ncbi:hypothetical protein [Calycomorphotria hydatis]|uniref:Uncharacterized protein n=1 Tax=Calycomorphotria hydatis TaxID=2528027 RepID=A0A517TBP9_9PLAN|nr:hypothetical protein [Calycomorphotria hydatis]QDT65802.1 hypothetical protein V22_30640 [Calycomorphotria hydatis]
MDPTRLKKTTDPRPDLAIVVAKQGEFAHTGIMYARGEGHSVIDQRQDYKTSSSSFEKTLKYFGASLVLAVPDLLEAEVEAFAGACRDIARNIEQKRLNFRYALKMPVAVYNEETGMFELEEGEGVTCSFFVLMVFEALGYPLIDFKGWVVRDGDVEKNRRLAEQIQDTTRREYLIQHELYSQRASPEEVGGAALCEIPVLQNEAEPAGKFVAAQIEGKDTITG